MLALWKYPKRAIEAAAQVLRNSVPYYVNETGIAERMMEAAGVEYRKGHWLMANLKDGALVEIFHLDKGDNIPGFDEHGNRFEAYTSYFRFKNNDDIVEAYSQTDRLKADASGNIDIFRVETDMVVLEGLGIDTSTIEELDPALWPA